MSSFSARLLSSSRPRLGGRSASLQPLTQSNSSSIHVHRPISLLVTDSGRYILRNGAVGSGKKVGAGSSSSGSATKRSWSTSTKAFRPIGVLSTPTSAMSQQAAVAASAATSATLSTNSLSTLSVVAAAPPPINKAYIHQPAYEPNRTRRRFASSLDTSMTTAATRNLILEILHSQPSLRDSKGYLHAFGPRPPPPAPSIQAASASSSSQAISTSTSPKHPATQTPQNGKATTPRKHSSAWSFLDQRQRKQPAWAPVTKPLDVTSPHHHASSDQKGRSQEARQERASSGVQGSLLTGAEAEAAVLGSNNEPTLEQQQQQQQEVPVSSVDVDQTPHSQDHVALVKIQGPFTPRQLASIAEGMVYLKRLGLVSIIVVDNEDWQATQRHRKQQRVQRFDRMGKPVGSAEEVEEQEFRAAWSPRGINSSATSAQQSTGGNNNESLRKRMIQQTNLVSELLCSHGAQARPFPYAIMKVDASAAEASRTALLDSEALGPRSEGNDALTREELANRSPLVADDNLTALRSALLADQIPVLTPLALYNDTESGAIKTAAVSADDFLVNLAREMSLEGTRSNAGDEDVDLTPVRLMIINREGGIPSHARGGSPHLSINLASEYKLIKQSFIWDKTHPTARQNLSTARACLSYMPQTSSGIVVSHRSPRSLIANLITNKAAHSPSLPHRLLAGRQDQRHTPTIIRSGLSVRVLYEFEQIDWNKMTALLEASFRKQLNRDAYIERIMNSLDFVIVTGDYEGAAIVTKEYAPSDEKGQVEPIAYLDKFAMLPSLQGSGAVDFLWGALRDEVHGLGLLDALNDNGGKGGFGSGRDLVWKSRAANPVNRWYYERSNGFAKIDCRSEHERATSEPQLTWALFWCDAEERLASMAGEFRLGASARPEDVMDLIDEEEEQRLRSHMRRNDQDPFESDFSLSGSKLPSPTVMAAALAAAGSPAESAFGRNLNELRNPERHSELPALLPVVAPDEQGRIQRWAECMRTIPSAWM